MGRAKKGRRREAQAVRPGSSASASASTSRETADAGASVPWSLGPRLRIALAAIAALALCATLRALHPAPWSYDEYYHLGLARVMQGGLRVTSFRWTPFSVAFHHFADGSPLFHLLLMPFASRSLETAGVLGALLGQLFVVATFAGALLALRVPRAPWLLLALPELGAIVLQRLEMCRPQAWLIGFALLTLALLALRRWRTLAVSTALFGLAHTAGWIAIGMALAWTLAGLFARDAGEPADAPLVPWQPIAATAGGWLLGQLVHPELPANFRTIWLSNFVIPYQSTAAGDALLRSQLGTELQPPNAEVVQTLWPAYVVAALLVGTLLRRPQARTRSVLATALVGLGFLVVGSLAARRFLELGAPVSLLALGLAWRADAGAHGTRRRPALAVTAAIALLLAALTSVKPLLDEGYGVVSAPLGMAQWLGAHGKPGERVFTAQWADSAPLFYAAPQLQSLVLLDPTAFWLQDPALFARYAAVAEGREPDPMATIRARFGARWVTVWKAQRYQLLANQLYHAGAPIVFDDPSYMVFDLAAAPSASGG